MVLFQGDKIAKCKILHLYKTSTTDTGCNIVQNVPKSL